MRRGFLHYEVLFINTAEKGKIFSWGDGKKGQLGHGAKELTTQSSPKHSKVGAH